MTTAARAALVSSIVAATVVGGSCALMAGQGDPTALMPVVAASSAPRATGTASPGVVPMLDRAALASRAVGYRGLAMVTVWSSTGTRSALLDVVHLPGQGTSIWAHGTANNPATQLFNSAGVLGPAEAQDVVLAQLARNYNLETVGVESVAGRSSEVITVSQPDGAQVARLWLDAQSGLLLRRETFDDSGRVLTASVFLSLTLTPTTSADGKGAHELGSKATAADTWGQRITKLELARLRAQGWPCPQSVAGGLDLVLARIGTASATDPDPVVHLIYSDGLATVSVFVQRGALDTDAMSTWRATTVQSRAILEDPGPPDQWVWAGNGYVFTLVSDAGPQVNGTVLTALPGERPVPDGVVPRLGRGVRKVLSWLNPFS